MQSGSDILVECLLNHGVEVVFAYPGGASMPLHQSLTRYKDRIRTILPRHEQGGGFAAQGYARTTRKPGVCMATSGPGATNLVTCIADAKLDSIPLIAITGQVKTAVIGSDAFQETPIVEVCRGITKHHYLITDVADVPRVMREAFHIATTGRPGPVLVDVPKDVQQAQIVPDYDAPMNLPGYHVEDRKARPEQIAQVAAAIKRSKRPVIYGGGGVIMGGASPELRELVRKTKIPVTMTLMGLGAYPGEDPLSLDMLGMHGSVYANYAVDQADLLMAFGVRFDDRVTGKVSEFAKHGKIVHIDVDPSEINKNKEAHIPIVSDIKYCAGRAEQGGRGARGPERLARADRGLEKERPVQVRQERRRDLVAVRDSQAVGADQGSRHDRHRGRGPAPDVGRPALQAARAADLVFELGPGHDGLWPAGRDGRQGGPSRQAGDRHRRRRQLPDEHPGAGHLLLRKDSGQGAAA